MNANELADGILAIEERIFLTKKEHQLFQNSAAMLRKQQAEIEALKAGKIRAYDNGYEDGRKPNTHPVKELTDEKIGQIWKDCMESPYMQVNNPVGFARAILKKAQEK